MGIKDQFLNFAADFAQEARRRELELDQKLADLETERAKIEAERKAARGTFQRLSNYPVMNGADYLCPQCWITRGGMTPMRPIPSQTHNDLFRCPLCHITLEIEH